MNKKPEVIGVTTEYGKIAQMLGVEDEKDFGLYQETEMGKYYARVLNDGTFSSKVVRLISYEQAKMLQASIIDSIGEASKKAQEISASIPVIDSQTIEKRMTNVKSQIAKQQAPLLDSISKASKKAQEIAKANSIHVS